MKKCKNCRKRSEDVKRVEFETGDKAKLCKDCRDGLAEFVEALKGLREELTNDA